MRLACERVWGVSPKEANVKKLDSGGEHILEMSPTFAGPIFVEFKL